MDGATQPVGKVGLASWQRRLNEDCRRVFVLDDDPTGTQTTSDTPVILSPSPDAIRRFVRGKDRGVHILTNTRAIESDEAVRLVREIVSHVDSVCEAEGTVATFVLRGDSTLRGHVFAEIDALASSRSVTLFVPALPEAGRVTIGGTHWLIDSGQAIAVSQTEYARDPVFGYESETLEAWVAETGSGRSMVSLPISLLRTRGPAAVSRALLELDDGAVLIPDAVDDSDIRAIAWGLLDAEDAGRRIVVRSSAPFATTRYGGVPSDVSDQLASPDSKVLVVCGSHTSGSTRQLGALRDMTGRDWVTMRTDGASDQALGGQIATRVVADLEAHGVAVLATERERRAEHGGLDDGTRVMDALMSIVAAVAPHVDVVVSKGGITSAEVTTSGFSALSARVLGQALPGIPVWHLNTEGESSTTQIVVPGNVGDDVTLAQVLSLVHPSSSVPR